MDGKRKKRVEKKGTCKKGPMAGKREALIPKVTEMVKVKRNNIKALPEENKKQKNKRSIGLTKHTWTISE